MLLGFIGVGIMGGALARNLVRAQKKVLVFDLNKAAVDKTLAAGDTGRAVAGIDELAACDVVFTSLPLPEHVQGAMSGSSGLYSLLKPGATHIELSTIDPQTAESLASEAHAKGLGYIQCTLGKTPAQAEKAEEPMFIGGDKALVNKLEELFQIIGQPIYVGSIAASCAVKLISNMVGMTNLAVLAEGLRVGERAGLDRALLLRLLADTGARSFQMDVRGPWIAADDYEARFGLDLALKDVRLGCAMAKGWDINVRLMQDALEYYAKASGAGLGKEDCNAVYKVVG